MCFSSLQEGCSQGLQGREATLQGPHNFSGHRDAHREPPHVSKSSQLICVAASTRLGPAVLHRPPLSCAQLARKRGDHHCEHACALHANSGTRVRESREATRAAAPAGRAPLVRAQRRPAGAPPLTRPAAHCLAALSPGSSALLVYEHRPPWPPRPGFRPAVCAWG